MTTSEALAFFKTNGYVVIEGALTPDEVAFLNDYVDGDMAAHPDDWRAGEAALRGHAHPLMEHPELDPFVQHPGTFPLMREILGDEIRFGQFDFRDVPSGVPEIPGQRLHGDRAHYDARHPHRNRPEWDPEHPYQCGYLCAIHYLTEVHDCCPCFGIVPGSGSYPTLEEARAGLRDTYREVPIRGPAGTALIYNIATYHGRMAGTCTHGRRTLHAAAARSSRRPQPRQPTGADELVPRPRAPRLPPGPGPVRLLQPLERCDAKCGPLLPGRPVVLQGVISPQIG